jgi:hypothetical protein
VHSRAVSDQLFRINLCCLMRASAAHYLYQTSECKPLSYECVVRHGSESRDGRSAAGRVHQALVVVQVSLCRPHPCFTPPSLHEGRDGRPGCGQCSRDGPSRSPTPPSVPGPRRRDPASGPGPHAGAARECAPRGPPDTAIPAATRRSAPGRPVPGAACPPTGGPRG